jgi:TrmH family RNA methyltransferase
MVSKSLIKLIKSLKYNKFRELNGLFVAEGEKIVNDLITTSNNISSLFKIHSILAISGWLKKNKALSGKEYDFIEITEDELKQISLLTTPNKVLALVKIPDYSLEDNFAENNLSLIFDDIQDPGNLGTIIRVAHWFGINNIICSENSADLYNPKTIQSTMGSLWSVKVFYKQLKPFLRHYFENTDVPVIGTFLSGSNIYSIPAVQSGLIVLGNEAHGISKELEPYIRSRIYIPPFSEKNRPDSINVAQAAAIICSELRRDQLSEK